MKLIYSYTLHIEFYVHFSFTYHHFKKIRNKIKEKMKRMSQKACGNKRIRIGKVGEIETEYV